MEPQPPEQKRENKTEKAAEQSLPEREVVPPAKPSESENATPPAGNEPKRRCRCDKRWRNPQVIVNGALAAIAVIAAIIYFCQLQQMKHQLVIDQRAWLTVVRADLVKPLVVGEKITATIRLLNSGKTPASEVQSSARIFSRFIKEDIVPSDIINPAGLQNSSHAVIGPATHTYFFIHSEPIREQREIDVINSGEKRLFATGFVSYLDIFKRRHTTTFCFFLLGTDWKEDLCACEVGNIAD